MLLYCYNNGTVEGGAHSVSVMGYKVVKNLKTKKTNNLLLIADGWHNKLRYINYTEVDFYDCSGIELYIK